MHGYVYQDADDDADDEPLPDEYDLGYPFATAISLWLAWRDHGTMPRAGGYLDQPRRWQRMIDIFNSLHSPIYRQYMAEKYPEKPETPDVTGDGYLPVANGWNGLNWIE